MNLLKPKRKTCLLTLWQWATISRLALSVCSSVHTWQTLLSLHFWAQATCMGQVSSRLDRFSQFMGHRGDPLKERIRCVCIPKLVLEVTHRWDVPRVTRWPVRIWDLPTEGAAHYKTSSETRRGLILVLSVSSLVEGQSFHTSRSPSTFSS